MTHSPTPSLGDFPHPICKRIAFAKVCLPNGRILLREIVAFDPNGKPAAHFPLQEEIPFVEWKDATFVWPANLPTPSS